ncbi:TPA: hypothetical protein DDW69_01475 [candidate division CPR2 bacterium]|uniref:Uncharacterized protein n=1 Tax=candidate division CPR2 bacterium GW2011_GWC1_41_48 TaxID=1618344 RepID=A0A0G0WCC2_UNCC2|nr:MAG: hypothetical protein UT47_C0001G0097 [candidate division CPR2 bacterium GW2011_GWC2_39_35]KKR27864.1 MAG: hypothetical protein UT60_C0034G0012 [candidate division CPR2 bacterium GW2011_GWD2_39_7]KKS09692.1 MAG: hypothetical protein UU65_C0001G0097 [candidate division CPR2 bacterium GW2011_GWC1_41_48]OGB71962.1 MAG: hypothetical protein A2Y26_01560 [candidate division CPR2 bacterium GWD2_39_7]HBG81490.1 hypothetical protein [candidate division CPR2 bacterium]
MNQKIKLFTSFASSVLLLLASFYPSSSSTRLFWYYLLVALLVNVVAVLFIAGPKLQDLKQKWDFFILPILLSIGIFFFVTYYPSKILQILISLFFGSALFFVYNSLSACRDKKLALPIFYRNLLTILSLGTIFLMSGIIYNFYLYWELPVYYLILPHFIVVFGINHFLTKHMLVAPSVYSHLYNLIMSLIILEVSWVLSFWSVNYPAPPEKISFSYLGIPVASIIILIVYYCIWGMVYYLIEGRLTKKVIYEYLSVGAITLILILLTTKWLPIV